MLTLFRHRRWPRIWLAQGTLCIACGGDIEHRGTLATTDGSTADAVAPGRDGGQGGGGGGSTGDGASSGNDGANLDAADASAGPFGRWCQHFDGCSSIGESCTNTCGFPCVCVSGSSGGRYFECYRPPAGMRCDPATSGR